MEIWREKNTRSRSKMDPLHNTGGEKDLCNSTRVFRVKKSVKGEIYELFMGLKSQVELTPPRPGQLGR